VTLLVDCEASIAVLYHALRSEVSVLAGGFARRLVKFFRCFSKLLHAARGGWMAGHDVLTPQ